MSEIRIPPGYSINNADFYSYTKQSPTLRLYKLSWGHAVSICLFYRYALDKYGRKSVSPFSHNSGGTLEVRNFSIWRVGVKISIHISLYRWCVKLMCKHLGHKNGKSFVYCNRCYARLETANER